MKLTHGRAVLLMLLVTLMWSTAGVITRHLEAARCFEVTFWRSAFNAMALLVILPLFMGCDVFAKLRHTGHLFWISGLCWCGMFTFFMVALMMTSVANVLVTMSLGPLLTAVLARYFNGHRMAVRTWVAIVVAGVGMAWMFGAQFATGQWLGTLVALGVPLAGAINWTVTQRAHAQGHDIDMVPAVLVGALLSCAVTLWPALPFQATEHDLLLLAGLGLGQLAIPCVLSVICARVLAAPEVSLLALLEVLFGIALAWFGAGEKPGAAVLGGGVLVMSALLTNEWLGWRARAGQPSKPLTCESAGQATSGAPLA